MTGSDEVCGCELDDRDDPTIEYGHGYSCELELGHTGPHAAEDGTVTWA